MRQLIRNTFLSIAGSTKSVSDGVHILNSHYISKGDVNAEVFYDLLKQLSKHVDLIKIEDALDLIQNQQVKNKKCIAFTFDDGFEECFTKIAPVIEQFDSNALFFINPGFIDGNTEYIKEFQQQKVHVDKNPMNWNQIQELHHRGFIIGNHTLDHVRLINLPKQELEQQILKSKYRIEEIIDDDCNYFAWTYGGMNDISYEALQIALKHHKYAFSCDNYTKYFAYENPNIINRRHIEGDWPISHVNYFLSKGKSYS